MTREIRERTRKEGDGRIQTITTKRLFMSDLVLPDESYRVMGACFEVYKHMGCGFLEPVYQECLRIEFQLQSIPFVEKPLVELAYKDQTLVQRYQPDFICFGQIIIELKAVSALNDEFRSQVLNYLHAVRKPLAILVNFGHHPKLEYERIALTKPAGSG
jgi:GxxExxY protein